MTYSRMAATLSALGLAVLIFAGAGGLGVGQGAPAPGTSNVSQWAYGGTINHTATWTNLTNGYAGSLQAFFGWHVVLTQTNLSATEYQVEVQRTLGLDYVVQYCKPDCSNPIGVQNESFNAWESSVGFVNFTTAGTVYVGGAAVPALAIVNSANRVQANLTESVDGQIHVLGLSPSEHYYYSVAASSHVAIGFTPALGFLPDPLGSTTAWNSSSAFVASGGWSAVTRYDFTKFTGVTGNAAASPSGNASASGTIQLVGQLLGGLTLSNGVATNAVGISITGPFHLREGLLFVPAASDIFGGPGTSVSAQANTSALTTTESLNLGDAGHFGLLAASTGYTPSSSATTAAVVSPADTDGGTVLQAQPESVPTAQGGSTCLVAGNCPMASPPPAGAHLRPGSLLFVGLAVLVVGAIAAVVVVDRRRQVPAPPHPNAKLYPPGAAGGSAPPSSPPAPGKNTTPPGEPDPLGHLW